MIVYVVKQQQYQMNAYIIKLDKRSSFYKCIRQMTSNNRDYKIYVIQSLKE
jgi:hypothetical protein